VRLPTGYFIGMSAATGDLSDAHDIVSMRFFEIEHARPADSPFESARHQIDPAAEQTAGPRDHVYDPKPSKLGWSVV
jgi:hypothetical protein